MEEEVGFEFRVCASAGILRPMAITIVALHHCGIRIPRSGQALADARDFYSRILGLRRDPGRPAIPGVDGEWMSVGTGPARAQIHLMGVDAKPARAGEAVREGIDPSEPHLALAVTSIDEARAWLLEQDIGFLETTLDGVVQLFLHDPAGNMIELHQDGACRCTIQLS